MGAKTKDFTKGILREVTDLEEDCVQIITGKDLDKKINLVNIADETAHWLLGKPLTTLRENLHKKDILFKELHEFF